ncbi:MAG: dihydropteroate synthase [Candidatus Marinimicrobia bacterium]|nr:dihydropteroate synthase [Candidatus Neomarinimicrobiota bacterium]
MSIHKLLAQDRTLIMGVLNVTPDSFSDGGKFLSPLLAIEHTYKMIEEGADIIDIGGESSRPGSDPVSIEEEVNRVLPIIDALNDNISVPLSIDTYKSKVAQESLKLGVEIVNDISGLRSDPKMGKIISEYKAFVIIMHMKGTPKNMQDNPYYDNLLEEIIEFFNRQIQIAVNSGIQKNRIILDPGIGFGKRIADNFVLLNSLQKLADLGYPMLVGSSRKSFIGLTLKLPPNQRVEGTAATVTASILNGAKIVRVHDVKEMKRVVTIADLILRNGQQS